jgi:hypothetical protein
MPRRLTALILLCAALTPGSLLTSSAGAAQSPVLADCGVHGQLTHDYTLAQLRTALVSMSADLREYGNCYDVIERAIVAKLAATKGNGGAGSGGSSSGGSFLPTPLLIVLIALVVGAGGFGVAALRRRSGP